MLQRLYTTDEKVHSFGAIVVEMKQLYSCLFFHFTKKLMTFCEYSQCFLTAVMFLFCFLLLFIFFPFLLFWNHFCNESMFMLYSICSMQFWINKSNLVCAENSCGVRVHSVKALWRKWIISLKGADKTLNVTFCLCQVQIMCGRMHCRETHMLLLKSCGCGDIARSMRRMDLIYLKGGLFRYTYWFGIFDDKDGKNGRICYLDSETDSKCCRFHVHGYMLRSKLIVSDASRVLSLLLKHSNALSTINIHGAKLWRFVDWAFNRALVKYCLNYISVWKTNFL